LILNYLSNRKHFVQINTNFSKHLISNFGVPQGSILGPVLFNLCVADMHSLLPNTCCLQYADDSTLYDHCHVKDIDKCCDEMSKNLDSVLLWSKNNNLAFNASKTKSMIISTPTMSRIHGLDEKSIVVRSGDKQLEAVKLWKLLGMKIDNKFELKEHISSIIKESYATLRTLKKLKRFASFQTRKHLAESLILSRLDYCNALFHKLPSYTKNQIQKVQNVVAGFVLNKYANINDVTNLKWLPIEERI